MSKDDKAAGASFTLSPYDEMLGPEDAVRPHYAALAERPSALGPQAPSWTPRPLARVFPPRAAPLNYDLGGEWRGKYLGQWGHKGDEESAEHGEGSEGGGKAGPAVSQFCPRFGSMSRHLPL